MMDDEDLPVDPFRVSFPGPFTHHDVLVEGWRVPFLHAQLGAEDRVLLVLDGRLRVVPFVADAISVALGYGAHPRGDTSQPLERAPYPRPERVVDVTLSRP